MEIVNIISKIVWIGVGLTIIWTSLTWKFSYKKIINDLMKD